jgi:hypothetical protein
MSTPTADFPWQGQLVRPDPSKPDLVHLTRALATLCGVPQINSMPATRELIDQIGVADHYVFVLLDGLGSNLVRKLPEDSFMRRHLRQEIRSVCPSTTACALTSVATGYWPGQHGVTGWFTYLPDRRLSITTLPFTDRWSGESLTARGMVIEDILPLPAMHTRMSYSQMTLLPSAIQDTVYARYSRGGTPAMGYTSIANAIDLTIATVSAAKQRSYLHLYIPDIDTGCHHHGISDPGVEQLVKDIDRELARLASELNGRARIVVSADHGLIDVPLTNHMSLFHDSPLMKLLEAPPAGDARLPVFHVREGMHDRFVAAFHERYGSQMALMRTADAERLNVLGAGPMSPLGRRRFGDFIGIAFMDATLHYVPPVRTDSPQTPPKKPYMAQHAGMSRDEMEIPLIIA